MTEQWSLDKLECHFTWCPEEDSTNFIIEDVIKKTEKKIQRQPEKKAAHLTTLAYLYTRKTVKKLSEAQKLLEEALKLDAEIHRNKQEELQDSSEFVIRADMLHLKKLMRGKNRPLKRDELESEMEQLKLLWNDPYSRARLFAVKGITFDCFGPKKYAIGAKAFAEASKILLEHGKPSNFNWLWGEAFLRARCARQIAGKRADSRELELWKKAREIGERINLATATFYANYAEAILNNLDLELSRLCKKLTEKSMNLLQGMSPVEKENSHTVYIICLKNFRHLGKRKQCNTIIQRKQLFRDAEEVASVTKDPGFFLELSNEANALRDRRKAIELLEKGRALAGEPGHIWIELKHVEIHINEWEKEKVVATYDSLRETFHFYSRNTATIEFYKALYLIKQNDVKESVESCVAAFNADPELDQIWPNVKKDYLLRLKKKQDGFEEYLAWYAENVGSFSEQLDAESLYRNALSRDENNEFVLEHLGRFFIKKHDFDRATHCFRRLLPENDKQAKLLAESLLRDTSSDLNKLEECLECGCTDAASRILDILDQEKSIQVVAEKVFATVKNQDDSEHPVFFRTQLYVLCAKIKIAMEDPNSFSLNTTETESPEHPCQSIKQSIKQRVNSFLELNKLMSKVPFAPTQSDKPATEGPGDRGNLMRTHRIRLTKLNLKKNDGEEQDLNDLIVLVLKESKEVLDRSLAVRMKGKGREFAYPHAFNQIKKQLGSDYKKKFNQMSSESERKAFEVESLMKLLKENKNAASLENVRKCMQEELKRIDINFHQSKDTRDLFEFMVSREHRILSSEDGWIVRWIYLVNSEKHATEILVNELNEQLRSDWSAGGECKRTAYDVAHLAAEFAEETWAVFSSGVGSGEPKSSAAGEAAGVGADEGASQESHSEKPEMLSGPTRED